MQSILKKKNILITGYAVGTMSVCLASVFIIKKFIPIVYDYIPQIFMELKRCSMFSVDYFLYLLRLRFAVFLLIAAAGVTQIYLLCFMALAVVAGITVSAVTVILTAICSVKGILLVMAVFLPETIIYIFVLWMLLELEYKKNNFSGMEYLEIMTKAAGIYFAGVILEYVLSPFLIDYVITELIAVMQ